MGSRIKGDTLWLVDLTALKGFDVHSGALLATIDLSSVQPVFLNDMAIGPDDDFYVTDTGYDIKNDKHTGPDRIYHIARNRKVTVVLETPALDQPGFALTLSLPENPGQQFLFSPRIPQLAPLGVAAGSGQRTYLGFSIDVGDTSGLYGAVELGGSFLTRRMASFEDSGPRSLSAPLMLHGGFELGYRPDAQNSFALSVDQTKATEGSDRTSLFGTVRLRYGLKF